MKELLFSAALCAFAAPAYAGPLITVTGYSTPDGQGFNDVTTTAMGAADTPYSYYTGPVVFTLSDNTNLTVYCVDLNHFLQSSGTYMLTPLMFNGEGQSISEFDSNRIGHIAAIGAAAWAAGGTDNLDMAAAAQAAIWDISYKTDSPISTTADSIIAGDISQLLGETFADIGYATALQPFGQDWPTNTSAGQEMVVGFASGVPEPSTWAMGLMGFAGIAGLSLLSRRKTTRCIEA
jgi:hypothetical protein